MSSLSFSVDFNSTLFPQEVTLWLSKHEPPTPDTYDWTKTLPLPDDELFSVPWINGTFLTSSAYQWLLPEDVIVITDTDVDVYNRTDYFIGVRFGSDVDRASGTGEIVSFTLYAFETTCVYFEENQTHLWQRDGCRVGLMSNITHVHCQCDHLTKFAGFVAPNPLNIREVFSKNILENPTGLILVLTVFMSYVMGVVWARKADRKDIAKVGVGLLPGHRLNPRKECQYVITVYTGFRGNAGTTAEITLVLYGSRHESPPFTLRDDNRCLFEQGSVDSFLVSTEEPLGVLTHMRVWHNNAGFSPSWDVTDDHLWYSVAGRPARSPFTRVQRLSCCLTLLYSTMVTNIMFFGRGDDFDPPEPLKIAGLEINLPISLPQLMIGLQSAAIILPVNFLIVFLFRNSGKQTTEKTDGKKLNLELGRRLLRLLRQRPMKMRDCASDNPDTPSFWYSRDRTVPGNKDHKLRVLQSSLDVDVEESSRKVSDDNTGLHQKSSLPWWGVLLGWFLVWSGSFVAAFFTVLYTLSFGREKAEAWVCTFVTSFVSDLFLVQPVKLVLVAMIFALFTKKPVVEEDPPPTSKGDDEEYIMYKEVPCEEKSISPPDETVLAEARAKSTEKRKRRNAVLEVMVFSLFVTVIMLTAYNERSPLAFYMSQNVKEQIVKDIESFWSWLEDDLIPTTSSAEWDVLRESAGRCAGLPSGECGTSSGRVRYVLRESAVRPAGECGTFCGSQTFCSSLLEQRKLEVNDLRPACKQDWTGSGCNIKGAGGFC
ncbi:hypothetical protein Bbelb_065890 [Branchiostoma belcheri]|nr:hypothetical protein Bbelb_065890 [Branchiostoma belcheri]